MKNEKTLKILMLEDSGDDAGLIERTLKKHPLDFVSERVDTREDFCQAIKRFHPDVILSDHGMPEFNSIEALKISKTERTSAPFILVTGTVSDEFAARCLKLGADDYILKSNLARLPSSILRALKERKLIHLKREARRALRKQNDSLLEANLELQKVNHELDNFVYSVSHNLRGPLSSVLGLLNLADLEPVPSELSDIHKMIRDRVMRLDSTLGEIIEYSKNARNTVTLENVNLGEFIHAVAKEASFRDPGCIVNWIIENNVDRQIKTDKVRLRVVLYNILSNAIQYRDAAKELSIRISAEVSHNNLTIAIADNGIGIKQDILPRVYDMFYRGNELSQGPGLGLYVAREVVKRLSGSITIESEEGKGTRVLISLPIAPEGD